MIIGKIIDERYKVISKIAEGGMANIFLAKDTIFDTEIVLKVLKDEYDDPKYINQFKHEVDSLAELNHPNIIKVLDYKEVDGLHFIVMEYLDGITLKDLIRKKGKLSPQLCVDIISKVASGLKHAHNFGLIHRDLKPQNIMILKNAQIKLMDFGISQHVDDAKEYDADDEDNSVMGSVHYISPEQVKGEKIDLRSDIYAIGIIMYEMLTGEVPYNAATAVDIALMHLKQHIGNITELNPLVPQSLSNVVIRATSPDIKLRHQDIQAFEYDLTTCLMPRRLNEDKLSFVDTTKEDALSKTQLIDLNNSKIKEEIQKNRKQTLKNDDWDWKRITIIGGIVAFLCMLLLFISFFLQKNKMPDLSGKTVEQARQILNDELGVNISDLNINYEPNDKVSPKTIWKQYPYAQSQVTASTHSADYVLTVNDIKIEEYTTPDYVGQQLNKVKEDLDKKHINVKVEYSESNSNFTKKNQILSQSFKVNSTIKTGDTITFKVVKQDKLVELPNTQDLKVDDLVKFAQNNGMQIQNLDQNKPNENETCFVTNYDNVNDEQKYDVNQILKYHSECRDASSWWDKLKNFFGISNNEEKTQTNKLIENNQSIDEVKQQATNSIWSSDLSTFKKISAVAKITLAKTKQEVDKIIEESYR